MILVCVYEKILNMKLIWICFIFLFYLYFVFCFLCFWCYVNMKRRILLMFCDILVKLLKFGNVLKGCYCVVVLGIVEGGKRLFYI